MYDPEAATCSSAFEFDTQLNFETTFTRIAAINMIIFVQVVVLFLFQSAISAKSRGKTRVQTCQPFPYATLEHGSIRSSGKQKYTFSCEPNYFLASPRLVRCWRGKWSSTRQPLCIKSEGLCDDPPPIEGGRILGQDRQSGSVIQYMCHAGFVLFGEGKRTCLRSGHWSGITPSCMDESEPVQKVAERLKSKFVAEIGAHSSDSLVIPQGRLLDESSLLQGLELIILIDRSSSVDPEDFKKGVGFIKFLLFQFGVRNGNNTSGTRAAVLTFGTNVEILFNLDNATITNARVASTALDTLQPGGGGTAMQEALMSVFTRLPDLREGAKKALFMLTDGEPNIGTEEDTLFFARQLREERDFEIFTVGIGRGVNRQLLAKLASEPAFNHVFVLSKYSDLNNVIKTIRDKKPKSRPISPARCGYVQSENEYLKSWPWLSAIYIGLPDERNETRLGFCSGTLICSQWVLTAASCFYHLRPINETDMEAQLLTREVFPVLGENDLLKDDSNQKNFYAEKIVIHPEFNPLSNLRYNLALIKLNAPAPMGRFRPACLPPTDRLKLLHLDLNTNASIAGWGLAPARDGDRELSGGTEHLHLANISVALEEECAVYEGNAKENLFCAGGHGKLSCHGDLGSPLIAVDPATNLHHLIGVLGRKSNCHKGVNQYTEITKYIRWINDATAKCQLHHYMA